MNIFVLHSQAGKAARLHCDAHVIKMLLETTQILYTYLDSIGYVLPATDTDGNTIVPYKPTHRHHPCVLWLHGGRAHFKWLLHLANVLAFLYARIYDKVHACYMHIRHMLDEIDLTKLPDNCDAETWLQRLTARGIKPKIVQDCASKVATVDPPYGCAFGVACIGDDDSYWRTADGAIDLPKTYLAYYNYKRGIFKRPMRWRKQAKPPPEIEEWNTMGVSKCGAHASSSLGF